MGESQPGSGRIAQAGSVLAEIVRETQAEVAARRRAVPLAEVEWRAAEAPPVRGFALALAQHGLAVIAEMKARSPSAGKLAADYSPADLARKYQAGGAAAVSVLCQGSRFGGSPEHLAEARAATRLPLLRKDFVTDEYQVLEGRAWGADAILLIAAALEPVRLRQLVRLVHSLGMDALVEVHDEAELGAGLDSGTRLVGINHRDLKTLQVDLGLSERLRPLIPGDRGVVAESGIQDAATARRLKEAGVDAVLVGEALLRASDPGALIKELSLK